MVSHGMYVISLPSANGQPFPFPKTIALYGNREIKECLSPTRVDTFTEEKKGIR